MDEEQSQRADGLPLYVRPHLLSHAREQKAERLRAGRAHYFRAANERRHGLQHESLVWGSLLRTLLRRAALGQMPAY